MPGIYLPTLKQLSLKALFNTLALCTLTLSMLALASLSGCSDIEQMQPLKPNTNILAFGDSLTYGTGTSRDKAYPAQLAQLTGRNVINAGVPGEITNIGLIRLPGLIKRHNPELIILCHGANDILRKHDPDKISDNIQQMIDLANKNGSKVILIGVPEFSLILDSSPIYKNLAEKNQIPIENDVLGEIIGNNALKSDHIHPNAKGYRVLAEKIALLLKQSGAITTD